MKGALQLEELASLKANIDKELKHGQMVAATVNDVVAPAAGTVMVDIGWDEERVSSPLIGPELMSYVRLIVSVGEKPDQLYGIFTKHVAVLPFRVAATDDVSAMTPLAPPFR